MQLEAEQPFKPRLGPVILSAVEADSKPRGIQLPALIAVLGEGRVAFGGVFPFREHDDLVRNDDPHEDILRAFRLTMQTMSKLVDDNDQIRPIVFWIGIPAAIAATILLSMYNKNNRPASRIPEAPPGMPSFAPQGGAKWSGGSNYSGDKGYWRSGGWNYEKPPTAEQMRSGDWEYVPPHTNPRF